MTKQLSFTVHTQERGGNMGNDLQYKLGSVYCGILDACDSLQERISAFQGELTAAGVSLDHTGVSGPIRKLLSGIEDLRGQDFTIQTQEGD